MDAQEKAPESASRRELLQKLGTNMAYIAPATLLLLSSKATALS
jgi:hypothetical protein